MEIRGELHRQDGDVVLSSGCPHNDFPLFTQRRVFSRGSLAEELAEDVSIRRDSSEWGFKRHAASDVGVLDAPESHLSHPRFNLKGGDDKRDRLRGATTPRDFRWECPRENFRGRVDALRCAAMNASSRTLLHRIEERLDNGSSSIATVGATVRKRSGRCIDLRSADFSCLAYIPAER